MANSSALAAHDHRQLAGLEAEVATLRIENAKLKDELGRSAFKSDAKDKIGVLTELNDKLELDLDLALKEVSLVKRKGDVASAELQKAMTRNAHLESEVSISGHGLLQL